MCITRGGIVTRHVEFNSKLLRIIISAILFIISLFFHSYFYMHLIFIVISYLIIGYEIYIEGFKNLKEGEIFDENLLMIIATLGAFFIKEYNEAVIVMILFEIGEYLSHYATHKSKNSITELLDLRSDIIHLLNNGRINTTNIKKAKVGDLFIVKPGELIPLDGTVIDGYSTIDSSSLTGESVPRHVKPSYQVLSGTINLSSIITVKANSEYSTTTSTKIIELIENSNTRKTKVEKFITRFSKIYTKVVVILALLIAILPPLIFSQDFNLWIYKALELLVISCPCALIISVPLAFFCAIGRASKEGILIKGSKELDYLSEINAIVLDKTGTITKGCFEVVKVNSLNTISNTKILEIAAHAESYSNHPIAKAILNKYDKKTDINKIKDYKEYPGYGITCLYENEEIYIGNSKLLNRHNILPMDTKDDFGTIIYVANNQLCFGYIVISDLIKSEAYSLKTKLNEIGIEKIVMLSGDHENIVSKVANEIGINEYYGDLLPLDKVNKLKEINYRYCSAFIGDGINDAPVIKEADIGISMGEIGADLAIESSDIVLMRDNLDNIVSAISLSRKTKRIIKFNIFFAISFKLIIAILAIFGISSMWVAVFADVGVTLITVINSIMIMKIKI